MGLAAVIPVGWPPLRTYFVITLIVSLIGWTSLAREVRGKFLSLRSEDFVTAARLDGMSEIGIIFHHLVPSFMSHVIATLTLAIPSMISCRDRTFLPRHRPAAADNLLGRSAAGGAEYPCRQPGAVALCSRRRQPSSSRCCPSTSSATASVMPQILTRPADDPK